MGHSLNKIGIALSAVLDKFNIPMHNNLKKVPRNETKENQIFIEICIIFHDFA